MTLGSPTIAAYHAIFRAAITLLSLLLAGVSGVCPAWFVVLAGALSLARLSLDYRAEGLPLESGPLVRWIFLTLGIALGTLDFVRNHDIAYAVGHFLVALLPMMLAYKDRATGHWLLLLVTFLLSLLSLVAGNGIAEYFVFFLFAATAVFHLNAGHLYFHMGPLEAATRHVPERYFLPFVLSVAGGMSVGIGLFVFFPRSLQWYNPLGLRNKDATTGYTGKASLEGNGPRENKAIALIVESAEADWLMRVGPSLYFRGNTLDRFDGTHWTSTLTRDTPFRPDKLEYTGAVQRRLRTIRIFREPHTPPAVLYPGVLRNIEAPTTLVGPLRIDDGGDLLRSYSGQLRYTYEVTLSPLDKVGEPPSEGVRGLASTLARGDGDFVPGTAAPVSHYLQVPDSVGKSAWFRKWVGELGIDPARATVREAYGALLRNYFTRFKAVLGHEFTTERNLEAFLSRDREGHCEYFATAAALYLRSLGIPTRLVLGYRGGRYNGVSNVLEVREADAHTWLEILTPDAGWITLDPTPAELRLTPDWTEAFQQYFTAAKFWFERYVTDYNAATQKQLMRDISHFARFPKVNWGALGASYWTWAIFVLAGLLAYRALKSRRLRRLKAHGAPLPSYYRALAAKLAANGVRRAPGETHARFLSRVAGERLAPELAREVQAALEQDLYSGAAAAPAARAPLLKRIRALRMTYRTS